MQLDNSAQTRPGALAVLVEEPREEDQQISDVMQDFFRPEEFLKLNKPGLTGRELFQEINKEIEDSNSLVQIQKGGFLFVEYHPLKEVNGEWVNQVLERASYMHDVLGTTEASYAVGFYYEMVHELEDKKEEIARQLYRLHKETEKKMPCRLFILWKAAFGSLEAQKRGMVVALHVGSRVHQGVGFFDSIIQSLCYADFYSRRQETCQDIIDGCAYWLTNDTDQGMEKFKSILSGMISEAKQAEKDLFDQFESRVGLYPINISAYKKKGFGPFARYELEQDPDDKRLTAARQQFIENQAEEKVKNISLDALNEYLKETVKDADKLKKAVIEKKETGYVNLQILAEKTKSLEDFAGFVSGTDLEKLTPVVRKVVEEAYELVCRSVSVRESKKAECVRIRSKAQRELSLAGDYVDIQDFCRKVTDELRPPVVGALRQPELVRYALVSGIGADDTRQGILNIGDEHTAYDYSPISPSEVAMLKICDFLSAKDEESFVKQFVENIR